MAEEHGELSENCAEAQHQYKHTPLVQSCMEGKVFEHPMSGFELGDSKEPKVEVENTDSLALNKRKEQNCKQLFMYINNWNECVAPALVPCILSAGEY